MATIVGATCAAIGLAAFVWATYDSFDHDGFDLQAAVVSPLAAALGWQATPPGPSR